MMVFEILKNPDASLHKDYVTYKNKLVIGLSELCDWPINDLKLEDIHCLIQVTEKYASVKSAKNCAHYAVCDIRYEGEKILNIGDHITIGETTIKIKQLSFEVNSSQNNFKNAYQTTLINFPETQIILDAINQEISFIEQKTNITNQADDS